MTVDTARHSTLAHHRKAALRRVSARRSDPAPAVGRRGLRRLGAALAVLALVTMGSVLTAAPALAHDVLVSSDPANGSTLTTAPEKVTFTFDQPVENFDPALKIFGPNGNDFTTGAPKVVGTTVSAPMAAGPAGAYRAAYRIVSADGHPVTGQITFTLADSAAGSATGQPTASGAAPSSQGATATQAATSTSSSGGIGAWLWVIVAVAVVIVAAAIVVAVRKPTDKA